MEEIDSEKILALDGPTQEEKRRQEIEDRLNYEIYQMRKKGELPEPIIIGWQHIYNTYNSVERERWQKYGFARQTFRNLAKLSLISSF